MRNIKIAFSIEELVEVETALEYFNPKGDARDVAVYRVSYRVAKALGRPWVERYSNEDDAVQYYLQDSQRLDADGRGE